MVEGSPLSDGKEIEGIPLSVIPRALEILDLPPDDEDVLTVLRNAASGWNSGARRNEGHDVLADEGGVVSRKDWRAVCAALLGGTEDEMSEKHDSDSAADSNGTDSADEYVGSDGVDSDSGRGAGSEGQDSDEEYVDRPRTGPNKGGQRRAGGARKTRSGGRRARSPVQGHGEQTLTTRQRRECRAAFALFFPDAGDKELEQQRIGIRDISRVAALLKEKISAEEVSAVAHCDHNGFADPGRCRDCRLWTCSPSSLPPPMARWASPTLSG